MTGDPLDLIRALAEGGSGSIKGDDVRPIRPLAGCGHFAHTAPLIHIGGSDWGMTVCSEACASEWEARIKRKMPENET